MSRCTALGVEGVCREQACIASGCGNLLVDPGEMCDDGNTVPLDGCSADCVSTESCPNGVTDGAFGEQCDDGNGDNHDGCSSTCIAEAATWTPLADERPESRSGVRLAFDSKRNRVVMFGGVFSYIGERFFNDTFEWDGTRWSSTSPIIKPQARSEAQLGYDVGHGQTVLFSGDNGIADTWLWDGLRWTLAKPTMVPPARFAGAMVYDSKRDRLVMYGGRGLDGFALNDMWTWTGTDWRPIPAATVPPPRSNPYVVYDPKRDRIVMFGGFNATVKNELWEFDGTTWSPITFTGGPGPLSDGDGAFDPVSGHVVIIVPSPAPGADVWDWDGTRWTKRVIAFPDGQGGATITTDFTRGRIVLFTVGLNITGLFELVGGAWVQPPASSSPESTSLSRWLGSFVLDPLDRHVIGFGGSDYAGGSPKNDTLVYDGSWNAAGAVAPPPARYGAGAAFDLARKQMVLFGGCTGSGYLGDTYVFDTAWHVKMPSVVPDARCVPAMAYDAARKEVVMFGGIGTTLLGSTVVLADTWTWDGSSWTVRAPATSPPALYGATMAYDEVRHQLVLFGGHPQAAELSDETWIWDGATRNWIKQSTPIAPPRRYLSAIAWDYARRRLVLAGGLDDLVMPQRDLSDAWEWDGIKWRELAAQAGPALDGHGMVPGSNGGVLVIAGASGGAAQQQVWRLRHDGLSIYETCTNVDVDGDGLAGCADSDCDPVCVPCGDGTCDQTIESCASCPADCSTCAPACGDGVCQSGEVCAADC